jgi:hypothetical protein
MNEFELVKAGVHVDQHDKGNVDLHLLVFLVEAIWVAHPDCKVSMDVKATYNSATKKLSDVAFRGEPEVPVVAPLPAWFKEFSNFTATFNWGKAAPTEVVKGFDAYLKAFAEKGK